MSLSSSSEKESIDDEKSSRLEFIGDYNSRTQNIDLTITSERLFKPMALQLLYMDVIVLEWDCRLLKFSSSISLKIPIERATQKVDRHVFYNSFTLVIRYVHDANINILEATVKIEVPQLISLTQKPEIFKRKKLEHFKPASYIKEVFESDFKPIKTELKTWLKSVDSYIRQPPEYRLYNYDLVLFVDALSFEDLEVQRDLRQMEMTNVLVRAAGNVRSREPGRQMKKYFFRLPDELASLLSEMDLKHISVIMPWSRNIILSADIINIENNHLYMKTSFRFGSLRFNIPTVTFEFNRISTRACTNAVRSVTPNLMPYLSDFAKPPIGWEDEESKYEDLKSRFADKDFVWCSTKLEGNKEQQTAIKNIVNCTAFPFPYVIFGPPGTGKTSTLVECVAQITKLKPEAKILITTQSNSACDEIGSRLLESVLLSKILRIYSPTLDPKKSETLNKKLLLSSNMRNGFNQWPTKEEFGFFKIVIVTLLSSGRLVQSDLDKGHFDYIFIDECGSASEPESLVPFMGLGTNAKPGQVNSKVTANIVILGDHKQLGPVIKSRFAEQMGLGVSLMERMMTKERYKPKPEYDSNYVTQLLNNYRSHPAILQFSNTMFYDNLLRSKVDDQLRTFAERWELLPTPGCPVLFHCIKKPSEIEVTSSFNDAEVKQVEFYVDYLVNSGINGKRVEMSDIGIVSPYLAQLTRLRSVLNTDIEIGSAEYYQGREKKVIIISTVKSGTGIGFLKSEKRLNVMLTRAQSLLIVVGNPETLQKDPLWRLFVHYCHRSGAFAGETFSLTSLSEEDSKLVTKMKTDLKEAQKVAVSSCSAAKFEALLKKLKKLTLNKPI